MINYHKYQDVANVLEEFEVNKLTDMELSSIEIETDSGDKESVHIFDNVYKYPDKIRALSKRQNYRRDCIPGVYQLKKDLDHWAAHARITNVNYSFLDMLTGICPAPIFRDPNLCRFIISKSTLRNEPTSVRIHQDLLKPSAFTPFYMQLSSWQAVIYLNEPEDCKGGTATYRLKKPLSTVEKDHKIHNLLFKDEDFIETSRTEMKPNRLVTYPGYVWHQSYIENINDFQDTHRVVQTFNWKYLNT